MDFEPKKRDEIGPWEIQLQGRISQTADALVMLRGEVTSNAIRKLINKIELLVDEFPDAPNPDAPNPDALNPDARELLEALEDLANWWANWMPDEAHAQGGNESLQRARAAIAKARGE